MFLLPRTLFVAACAALVAPAFGVEWMTDLEAAKARAAKEGKAVLVDFTGSDWCTWCIRLRQDILDTPRFEAYAKDKFVFAEVDLPRNPKFSQEQLRRNHEICKKYKVHNFPTVLVLTPAGQVAGGFEGGRTGFDQVTAPLEAALENVDAFKAAEGLEGRAKLQALHAIYEKLPKGLAASLRAELAALDSADVTGIQEDARAEAEMAGVNKSLAEATQQGKDTRHKLGIIEKALAAKPCPKNLAPLLQLKLELQLPLAETEEDIAAIRRTLLRLLEAAPESPYAPQFRAMEEECRLAPAAVLRGLKAHRSTP